MESASGGPTLTLQKLVDSFLPTGTTTLSTSEVDEAAMIRKLPNGDYRLYSRKKNPRTGKRRNLGTFTTRRAAEARERAVQYFKHH